MDERIKKAMGEALRNFEEELQEAEKDLQELQKGLRIALSLYEIAQTIKTSDSEAITNIKYVMLETLQEEFTEWYKVYKKTCEKNGVPMDEWVTDMKPIMDIVKLFYAYMDNLYKSAAYSDTYLPDLPEDLRPEVENYYKNPNNSGRSYIFKDPVMKKITRTKEESGKKLEDIMLSSSTNTKITILNGYLTPYERDLLESVLKFKREGQVTQKGKIFCTAGQLYRALRGGGDQSPTQEQKEDIINDLRELEAGNRKISFELTNAQTVFEEFEMQGGRLRILSFDEFFGKIRGQAETLIVFDETPFLMMVSEKLGMFESVSQELKCIQERHWVLKLDTGGTIKGTTRECQKKLKKLGATKQNIIASEMTLRNMALTKNRISIRNVIISFVFSYVRARLADPPQKHSNQINYEKTFEQCEIGQTWNERDRAKSVIHEIMEHLKRKGLITRWEEYTNLGKKDASGVKFFIEKNKLIEVE